MTGELLLCAPSARTEPQQAIYEMWCDALAARGFRIRTLCREHYAESPWAPLAELMSQVAGVVVFGFGQMQISDGLWRTGTPESARVNTVWTSPWMQVEGGMAIASHLPVLAVPEQGVSEGIYAPENWSANLFGAAADDPGSPAVDRWAAAVRAT